MKEVQLLIAVVGIYFCYFKVGLIQEYLFKNNFGTMDYPSPKFEFSSVLIFLQMLFYNILCIVMVKKNKVKFVCSMKEGMYLGVLNFSSMIGALTALQYVSFPLQALTKSCKILSVLIVGLVLGNQKFTKKQVTCGVLITIGIYIFNISEGGKNSKTSSIFGIVLLLASLFSDGCLATLQSKFKAKHLGQWEMGFHISLWSFFGSVLYTILQGKFLQFLEYVHSYPEVITDIVKLTIFSVLGQVFIFYCINCFSPRVLSVVTTTRKFFTVLLSIIIHNHDLVTEQWFGIVLVAFGVSWELFLGMSQRIPAESKHKKHYQKIPLQDEAQKNGEHQENGHKHQ